MRTHYYLLRNGSQLITGPLPSMVPSWAPTELAVPMDRHQAAVALWHWRRGTRRLH